MIKKLQNDLAVALKNAKNEVSTLTTKHADNLKTEKAAFDKLKLENDDKMRTLEYERNELENGLIMARDERARFATEVHSLQEKYAWRKEQMVAMQAD